MTKASEGLAKLREPFPASTIGKLPRVWCKACRDAQWKVCDSHTKRKCRECSNNITEAHLHLDYVGHAEVTDRLLTVDPEWTWEPFSVDERGLPAFILNNQGSPVGLWIRLTVLGVTRLGYGSVDGNKLDAVKELIGDALRNASMRFGVALDLWSKADLESHVSETAESTPGDASPSSGSSAKPGNTEPQAQASQPSQDSSPGEPASQDSPQPVSPSPGDTPWYTEAVKAHGAQKVKDIASSFSRSGAKVTKLEQLDAATEEQRSEVLQALADLDWNAKANA